MWTVHGVGEEGATPGLKVIVSSEVKVNKTKQSKQSPPSSHTGPLKRGTILTFLVAIV